MFNLKVFFDHSCTIRGGILSRHRRSSHFFKKMDQPRPLFVYFRTQILQKNCRLQRDSNSDRRNEGEHANHLTTTMAPLKTIILYVKNCPNRRSIRERKVTKALYARINILCECLFNGSPLFLFYQFPTHSASFCFNLLRTHFSVDVFSQQSTQLSHYYNSYVHYF